MAASPVTLVSTAAATAARRWLPPPMAPAAPMLPAALPGCCRNSACSCSTVCWAKRRRAARGSDGTCQRPQLQRGEGRAAKSQIPSQLTHPCKVVQNQLSSLPHTAALTSVLQPLP